MGAEQTADWHAHTDAQNILQTGVHKWVLSKLQTDMHTRILKTYCRLARTNGC